MEFALIVVGDEILSGKRQDRHLAHVVATLAARGMRLDWARYEGDEVRGRLQVSTTAVVSEPALQLGIETDCGGSRAWRELPLLLKPSMAAAQDRVRLLPGGEWVALTCLWPALLPPGREGLVQKYVIHSKKIRHPPPGT